MDNDFEKSVDVLDAEAAVKELNMKVDELTEEKEGLSKKLECMVTCSICDERFESSGDKIPSKLKDIAIKKQQIKKRGCSISSKVCFKKI
jgi:hypothetical protein